MSAIDTLGRGNTFVRTHPSLSLVFLVGFALGVDLVHGLYTGRIPLENVSRLFWNGLLVGLILGLAGIGLSMTYSILNFANFSHGDLITVGAFSGWSVTYLLAGAGVTEFGTRLLIDANLNVTVLGDPVAVVAGLVLASILTILIALVVDRLVYRPMRDSSGISLLIASIGVALVLRHLVAFVYRAHTRGVTGSERVDILPVLEGTGDVSVNTATLMIVAVALMIGVHLLVQRTKLGTAMRAMADNQDLALITGIPTERVVTWTWILGAGLTGAAGFLIVLERGTLDFNIGWGLLLLIFAAVILGGIGSIYGAIGGGLVIGLTQSLSTIWIPSDFATPAAFSLMILVLLFRPSGLFSGVTTA
ncbi:branched-chain amino acid ABC transporter permease [Halobacteria archaeon AArc-m2/3/4]|uniref:Branched-chain amino acid ABC transporter permease n=1 Tax=Natronoglomus mannanivorans TaxID=2979990 RepID=A0ABT2Q9I9_9EURY|nr:branched-chain amino acid ABC transporter permease [Halobacteria archaeon AArc-m2/3/4]